MPDFKLNIIKYATHENRADDDKSPSAIFQLIINFEEIALNEISLHLAPSRSTMTQISLIQRRSFLLSLLILLMKLRLWELRLEFELELKLKLYLSRNVCSFVSTLFRVQDIRTLTTFSSI